MSLRFNPGKVKRKGQDELKMTVFSAMLQPGEGTITNIPVDQIDPWQDEEGNRQPFRLYSEDKMQELAQNIRENGIINPCIVRPWNGRYQLMAGHNRTEAAKLAGLKQIPCIVKDVDDDMAALFMIDSNLYQREQILPSERARAYDMKLRIYSHKGRRSDITGEERIEAAQRVANEAGDSARSVHRYARLIRLAPELLDMVDEGRIPVTVGSDVAGLDKTDQICVYRAMQETNKNRLSQAQADEITETIKREGQLQQETAIEILQGQDNGVKMMTLSIPSEGIPKRVSRKLKKDPVLQQMLLETVKRYLNAGSEL